MKTFGAIIVALMIYVGALIGGNWLYNKGFNEGNSYAQRHIFEYFEEDSTRHKGIFLSCWPWFTEEPPKTFPYDLDIDWVKHYEIDDNKKTSTYFLIKEKARTYDEYMAIFEKRNRCKGRQR